MTRQVVSMTEECAESYEVTDLPNGGIEIRIRVCERFKNLWLVKLTELSATSEEIEEWEIV